MKAGFPIPTITVFPVSGPGLWAARPTRASLPAWACGCGRTMHPALRSLPNRADTTY